MTDQISFSILEDIARDLSSEKVSFPTFLDITFQVRSALKNPNLTIEQLALLVGAEPLMSAKIIRMANSAALNPSGRAIADVKSAVARVGMEAVRSVSFAVAMEQLLGSKKMAPFEGLSQRLWRHAIHTAALCRVLARKLARINPDEAMFAGLVHDIGVFYLLSRAANFPELIADRAELHALLVQWHDNIGHALLAALGQPEAVLVAVQEHDVERAVSEVKTLADVLFVANKLANLESGWRDPEFGTAPDTSALAGLFDDAAIAALLAESEEELSALRSALGG
ncbi:MAG: metal-dependent phosphohydrolase [Candidatus Accumulibacter sp. 66-26]|nr:HDOD domain-containing protein [Accumulibacter sp.]OJW51708.1 MAG: metal-dependent phosphohydrolase [Candidatus Accumulibacter sp. 66-26]